VQRVSRYVRLRDSPAAARAYTEVLRVMDTAPELFDQIFNLIVDVFRWVYTYTIGMIAQALAMGPEGLPTWKLILWIVIAIVVVWVIFRLVTALIWYVRDALWVGLLALILAYVVVYVSDSALAP
jgi:hypothetical protein